MKIKMEGAEGVDRGNECNKGNEGGVKRMT
jgi:hypothetical protein